MEATYQSNLFFVVVVLIIVSYNYTQQMFLLQVAKLLVSIKKTTSLDNEVERKSQKLDNLKIDASSFDSVKHVKGI